MGIGRADSRFKGSDAEPTGAVLTADDDPSVHMSLAAPYTSAYNAYLRDELGCTLQRRYEVFHPTLKHDWKYAGYKNRTVHMGDVLRGEIIGSIQFAGDADRRGDARCCGAFQRSQFQPETVGAELARRNH